MSNDPLIETPQKSSALSGTAGVSLAGRVYGVLLQRIITGGYLQGQRLPTEQALCEEFKVSRPVLREALLRLKQEGWIQSRQGSGSVVMKGPENHPLSFNRIGTLADIQRCFEFRCAFEPEGAAHAARRRDSDDLLRIRSALEKLREATRNHEHREDADFEFHLAIAQASNNHYFATALNALHDHVAVGMKLHGLAVSGPRSELVSVYEEHSAIHTAIVAGDAAGAAEAMLAHLNSSRGRLFEGHALALTKQDKGLRE
ncbi:MAG: FadR family transcriptional regulator [Proteobacteria bacterium]|nr:FadR family transcriptional regulator [Pseudomonadota bacterium]